MLWSNVWLSAHSFPRCSALEAKDSPCMQRENIFSEPARFSCGPNWDSAPCLSSLKKSEGEQRYRLNNNKMLKKSSNCPALTGTSLQEGRLIAYNNSARNGAGSIRLKQAPISGETSGPIFILARAASSVNVISFTAILKSLSWTPLKERLNAPAAATKEEKIRACNDNYDIHKSRLRRHSV